MAARSGKNGRVIVAGITLKLKEWSTDDKADDLDSTNMESLGNDEGVVGIQGCDYSFRGDWDSAQNPIADPPGVYPRDDLANVSLFTNVMDGHKYVFPRSRVLSSKCTNAVRARAIASQ